MRNETQFQCPPVLTSVAACSTLLHMLLFLTLQMDLCLYHAASTSWNVRFPAGGRNFLLSTVSSLQSSGYRGLFPWGQSGRGVKLTTHIHFVQRSRMRGAIL